MGIKKTTNYSQFSTIMGNRVVDQNHVERLKKSILEKNLLDVNPILVNREMSIIDGQHRLFAAMELELPIYYVVIDGDLKTVQLINNSSKAWFLSDYVDSYIELGYQDYIDLKEFMDRWGISVTTAAGLLGTNSSHGTTTMIKNGTFKISTKDSAEETMLWASCFVEYTDSVTIRQRNFLMAIYALIKSDQIKLSALKTKLSSVGKRIYRQVSIKNYLREIEKLLNYKNRTNLYRLV